MTSIRVSENDQNRSLKFYCHSCGQKLDATGAQPFSETVCPSCHMVLIVPVWFDNYLLEELAGEGGMASVYRALDIALDREVAIKIFNSDTLGSDSDLFLHEARTAATINHYAIIPIYTCGHYEGQAYMVMQYMANGSLDDLLSRQETPFEIPQSVQWIRDVADGLYAASKRGIVHHDVKPGNIMIDAEGRAKIGDFGIANSVGSSFNARAAEAFKTFVTPNYVSPEKISAQTEDFRGDIYSLGATFFHLVTGQPPFQNSDLQALAEMRLTTPPPSPVELRADTPREIANLILEMMHLNPAKRPDYQTIIAKLDAYLLKVRRNTGGAGLAGAKKMSLKTGPRTPVKSAKGSLGSKIFLGLAVLGVGAAGVFAAVKISETAQTAPVSTAPVRHVADESALKVKTPGTVPLKVIERDGYLPQPVTGDYLRERCTYASSRPRIANTYEIDVKDDYTSHYLESLTIPEEKERELRCIEELNTLKPYLVRMMNRMRYNVSPLSFRGKKTVSFKGTLKVTNRYISVPIDEGRSANYNWEQLEAEQFAKFLRYYTQLRKEGGDKKEAASELMHLALFLEWNRQFDDAARTIEEAISIDPTQRQNGLKWFGR